MKRGRMKNEAAILVAMISLAAPGDISAKQPWERDGTVKDKSGTTTEVRGIDVVGDDKRFLNLPDEFGYEPWSISIHTPSFQTFVSLTSVVTLKQSGQDAYTITYLNTQGQSTTVTGRIDRLRIGGETDLGEYVIGLDRVTELTFKDPASPMSRSKVEMVKNAARNGTVSLKSGESVAATDLRRHARHVVTGVDNNYIPPKPWSQQRDSLFRDFRLRHGESVVTLPFDKIASIAFPGAGRVTVTLRSGTVSELQAEGAGESAITGFIFDAADGIRYYPAERVTKIVFPQAVEARPSGPTTP